MSCKICQSDNQRNLGGEVGIHFRGLKGLDKLPVFVFPDLLICLNCGFTEFVIPETGLQQLVESDAATV
jgi:hypothetical protein